jgi:hypothetical protein
VWPPSFCLQSLTSKAVEALGSTASPTVAGAGAQGMYQDYRSVQTVPWYGVYLDNMCQQQLQAWLSTSVYKSQLLAPAYLALNDGRSRMRPLAEH